MSHPLTKVSRTFTIAGIRFTTPIPNAPAGGRLMFTAPFVASKVGTFVWCWFVRCGCGLNGMSYAMSTMNWMTGRDTVMAQGPV
jgi:hypothetical protein